MLYDVHDAIARLPGSTPARETIVARSLEYLDRLAADAGDDPALRLDLAGAYFRIANVQGNPTDNNLGRTADALASYRRGLALLPAPEELPDSLAQDALTLGGRLHEKLGVTLAHAVAPDSALPHLDRAIAFQRRALALAPDDSDAIAYLATAHINRADYTGHPYFPNTSQPDSALAHYARARALLAPIPEDRATLFARRMHAITYEREGNLFRDRGDLDAALEPARRALALRQSIAELPEAGSDTRRDVGVSHEALGLIHGAAGRPAEAVRELETAFAIYQELFDADPASVSAQQTIAFGHLQLGRALLAAGRRAEGRRHLGEAARLFGALAEGGGDRWRDLAAQALAEQAGT
jgi:tetratricopeptide (TPR) repeat protein